MSRRLFVGAGLVLPACTTLDRGGGVPRSLQPDVTVLGLPNARFWADSQFEAICNEAFASEEREARHLGIRLDHESFPPSHLLAISGGGDDGAFGAGLLNGWTERGNRPTFKLVSGVSTGGLSAPFAFLGSSQDANLRAAYTEIGPDDVFRRRGWMAIPFSDGVTDSAPLGQFIARYLDQAMLAAIAEEYAKGRLLLILTTDLDAQRPVIWNIGAIAASGHPKALILVRDVLRASASAPGAVSPVMIDVEAGGKSWQEMHVDGGVIAQTFLYPTGLRTDALRRHAKRERYAYLIRNSRLGYDGKETHRNLLAIAGKAISTMIGSSGQNDILRVQNLAQRDGVRFNLAYIGEDFQTPWKSPLESTYMRSLYDYGRTRMLEGRAWVEQSSAIEQDAPGPEPEARSARCPMTATATSLISRAVSVGGASRRILLCRASGCRFIGDVYESDYDVPCDIRRSRLCLQPRVSPAGGDGSHGADCLHSCRHRDGGDCPHRVQRRRQREKLPSPGRGRPGAIAVQRCRAHRPVGAVEHPRPAGSPARHRIAAHPRGRSAGGLADVAGPRPVGSRHPGRHPGADRRGSRPGDRHQPARAARECVRHSTWKPA